MIFSRLLPVRKIPTGTPSEGSAGSERKASSRVILGLATNQEDKVKSERKKLVSTLDKVFSLYIRNRDKQCVICGSRERLTCGHLLTRTAYSTRWDEMNCACQCVGCNGRHEWDASKYTVWFLNKFGKKAYEELALRHYTIRKFTNEELKEMIQRYK